MKEMFMAIIGIIAVVAVIAVLSLGGRLLNLKTEQYFAPKEENLRREVYENTASYVGGKKQELSKLMLEYKRAEGEDKDAIAATVRIQFADFDKKKLEVELVDFITECNERY